MDELQGEVAAAHRSREEAAFAAQDAGRLRFELAASEERAAAAAAQAASLLAAAEAAVAGGGEALQEQLGELLQELQLARTQSPKPYIVYTVP